MSRSVSASEPDAQDSTARGVAIDVRANDLVHIGTDDQDYQHYYDAQRDRIVVTTVTAEEYVQMDTALVRARLVAGAVDVEKVIDADGKDPSDYVEFVDEHVDDREWAAVQLTEIDTAALLGAV